MKYNLRAIDAAMAEHVMGLNIKNCVYSKLTNGFYEKDQSGRAVTRVCSLFYYSSDISEAWQVQEKMQDFEMKKQPKSLTEDFYTVWCEREFEKGPMIPSTVNAYADTAELAICLCALKAKGIDITQFEVKDDR